MQEEKSLIGEKNILEMQRYILRAKEGAYWKLLLQAYKDS